MEQLLYLLTGAMAGLLAGLLGVGGGIIVVPILNVLLASVFPAELTMHMAIGTSLAIMIFTASSSALAYQRRGLILWPLFIRFIPGMMLGAIAGSIIAMYLSSYTLQITFAIFLLLAAIKMCDVRKPRAARELFGWLGLSIAAVITGLLSGFFGVGGGTLMVPFFVYCNVVMQNATGTSSACAVALSIIGTLSLTLTGLPAIHQLMNVPVSTTGYVYWLAVLPVAITSVLFAPLGTRIAVWLPPIVLQRIFAVLLIITAIYLLK